MRAMRSYLHSTTGNVAVIFSLALVPMLLGIGVAVDMMRVNEAKTVLQAAADAAALAAGASEANEGQIRALARKYVDADMSHQNIDDFHVRKIETDTATGAFQVKLDGKVKTSFMVLAGIDNIEIGAMAEVKRGTSGPLEMVLSLDTTYSMSENDKIGTLKTAATSLVNAVMTSPNVKVGIVPFSDYQQVGMQYVGEPWLNIPPDETGSYESCTTTYPNKSGCSMQTTCYSDGAPYSCEQEVCTYWGPAEYSNCVTVNYNYQFAGCVKSRPQAYHDSISDPESPKYPGVTWSCGSSILEMTTSKSDVLDRINALYPSGETYIPSGLLWGWNMLTPEQPLTAASSMADVTAQGGKKALVLMTDGANTRAPHPVDGWFSNPYDMGYGAGADYANGITASLCNKIKAEGTIVYTVLFDVEDSAVEDMLRNCATEPEKSFVADDAGELIAAFEQIGVSLTQLRLTK